MTIEIRTNIDCNTRQITAVVKHLESGVEGEAEVGDNEVDTQRRALLDLAHKLGKIVERCTCPWKMKP